MNATECITTYTSINTNTMDAEELSLDYAPVNEQETLVPTRKSRQGMGQTVHAIKKMQQLEDVADWLYVNKDPQYLMAFQLGINLGLRANELLGMKVGDVFFSDGSVKRLEDPEDIADGVDVYQSKTNKRRTVFLNEACARALEWRFPDEESRRRAEDYLVVSREGHNKPILVNTMRRILKDAAEACGIKQNIGTHTMRKTWGYWQHNYLQNNSTVCVDISHLQALFGHSSSATTLRYVDIWAEDDKRAFNSVSLDVVTPTLAKH